LREPKPPHKATLHEKDGKKDVFAALIKKLAPQVPSGKPTTLSILAPLAHLAYEKELAVKNRALALFWKKHRLSGVPEPVIPAPQPRAYRTTSKRRSLLAGKALYLFLGEKTKPLPPRPFTPSPLELDADERIYRFLQAKLSEPAFQPLASQLNYLIVRGSAQARVVIFNVAKMDGKLVKKMKAVAGHLSKKLPEVGAAFAYLDPTRSDYYLESRRPDRAVSFKKLFGPDRLQEIYEGVRYFFHPTSFSQVNEAIVPVMLRQVREMLRPEDGQALLDLYCGYGLFSLFLAPSVRQVLAIDAEGPSVRAAIGNSKLAGRAKANCRFLARRITGPLLDGLAQGFRPDLVLLDPPRQGPQADVIPAVCRRRPARVLHIFCGVDQIPASLAQWRQGGYGVERVVPLDMFAGTANLEVLVLLRPAGDDRSK